MQIQILAMINGNVALLVEQHTVNQKVPGSIALRSTKSPKVGTSGQKH